MSGRIAGIMMWLLLVVVAPTQAQTVEYLHTDALGSVVAVTDANRNVIERREYEPYGSQLTPAVTNGPGYTGHVQDAATGLVYMQQRYYDAQIGRFLSVDPVTADGNTGGNFNRYAYANDNPYSFTDPDGRCGTHIKGHKAADCTTISVNPPKGGGASGDSAGGQQASSTAGGSQADEYQEPPPEEPLRGGISDLIGGLLDWSNGECGETVNCMTFPLWGTPRGVVSAAGNSARTIPWSSKTVRDAAKALQSGATDVRVASRSQAEELFLGRYQSAGYRNTTGMSPREAKDFYGGKAGTYHWDTGAGAHPHGSSHLQIHTREGQVVRIFFPE